MDDINADLLGLELYQRVFGEPFKGALEGVREFTVNHLFAHVWSCPGLSLRDRRVISIALLAAQGRSVQLKKHILGAYRGGFSKEEMLEIMIHVAHYAGWAAGTDGQETALDVFPESKSESDPEQQSLKRLNEEVGEREKAGDSAYFQALLADDFVFRRADGNIVHNKEYLQSLEKVSENPYERLDTHVREVMVDKDSAVATVLVIAKRKSMERPRGFDNVRLFKRESGEWKLIAWINTRQD